MRAIGVMVTEVGITEDTMARPWSEVEKMLQRLHTGCKVVNAT